MNKLSVILVVRNEEKNIKRCLESVKWADEIVVIDQSSTDRTVEIARAYTDKIFVTEPKNISEPDRALAVSKTSNGWVFMIDADEEVPAALREEMLAALAGPAFDVYMTPRRTFISGKPVMNCGWYPSRVPRFFKKGMVRFPARIHANGDVLTERVGTMGHDLLHYTYNSVGEWAEKFNRYTSRTALEQFEAGKKITAKNIVLELLARPVYYFLYKYLFLKGYKDGWRGWFVSFTSGLVGFFAFIKLWELHERNSGGVNAG